MVTETALAELDEMVVEALPTPGRVMAPVQWYGGKGNMAKRLMPLLPQGRVYVEPYCGAASMFWHLDPPRPVEVLNDIYGEIINLFRVLQDPTQFEQLRHRLLWTPYSLDEFRRALAVGPDASPVERAWALFVRQNQGFSGTAKTEGNWSRRFTARRGMAGTTSKWRARLKLLACWHDRLTRVQLDNRDALEVIRYWDSSDTVFYLDPPYVLSSRVAGSRRKYAHECDDAHHRALVDLLLKIQGNALLSGYDNPLYKALEEAGWERYEFRTACHAAARTRSSNLRGDGAAIANVPRVEVAWVWNPGKSKKTAMSVQHTLFPQPRDCAHEVGMNDD